MPKVENYTFSGSPTGENPLKLPVNPKTVPEASEGIYGDRKWFISNDPGVQADQMRYHPDGGHRVAISDARWVDILSNDAVRDAHEHLDNLTKEVTSPKVFHSDS